MGIKSTKVDGKSCYVVTASVRTKDGKRFQRKRNASNLPEAKALERELHQELTALINGKPNLTWKEFLPLYFFEVTESNRKQPSTLEVEKCNFQKHVTPNWEKTLLKDITPEIVRKLIYKTVGDKSPQTKKHLASNIRAVLNLAVEHGYIAKNPAQHISFRVHRKQKSLPPLEEIRRVITVARERKVRWYPLWHFLALTGMRSGEAFALRWRAIDLNNKKIMINESWTRRGGFKANTKNHEWRTVPINTELKTLILELKQQTFQDDNSFVLPRIREWEQGEAAKSLKLFMDGLQIQPMRLHDFRAVFITEMLRAGEDVPSVMRICAHKRLETCLMYVALAGLDVAKKTDKLSFLDDSNNTNLTANK
jgi:integrase